MAQIPFWVLFISFFLLIHVMNSEENEVKQSLINFLGKLSNSNGQLDPNLGWNMSSDPCKDHWAGVTCYNPSNSVRKIVLDEHNLSGILDASYLCGVKTLAEHLVHLSLNDNNIGGEFPAEISDCKQLAQLHINGNQFSGNLPDSLSRLNNLKKLEISNNQFSGNLPNVARITGLTMFLAQNNHLTGSIPEFDFSNLAQFDVSYNNFSGPIPNVNGKFSESSFLGNPGLCGDPLPIICPKKSKGVSLHQLLMYLGYIVLGLALVFFIIFCKVFKRTKTKEEKIEAPNKVVEVDESSNKPSAVTSEYKTGMSRSDISIISTDSVLVSSSLVVLTSPVANGLKLEDLLKAPAELLGRGKHSSIYKVVINDGMTLAVKRIKDWAISKDDFKWRMQKIDQVKHPNVLPPLAFYCSKQEKLLVYEYQKNGSLFKFLHGTQMGQQFDWASRLNVASRIAEALAFMHHELRDEGIGHGNLKSNNILFNKNMEPCISEYGLMEVVNQDLSSLGSVNGPKATGQSGAGSCSTFKADIYAFGVILLELLTGKLVQQNGFDLARWVHSVVQEEWTVEVFDKSLISEAASEERMVNLLQVAIKCVNRSPEARPNISQVTGMINSIKEADERSIVSEV